MKAERSLPASFRFYDCISAPDTTIVALICESGVTRFVDLADAPEVSIDDLPIMREQVGSQMLDAVRHVAIQAQAGYFSNVEVPK